MSARHDGHTPMPEHGDIYRDRMVCETCDALLEYTGDGLGNGGYAAEGGTPCPDVVLDPQGNVDRMSGCDRCYCGCKYWEYDRCIDCGGTEVAR